MSLTRIYQPVPLEIHASFRLDDKASHHLARVLRAKIGDEVIIFNGEGGEYSAKITAIDRKGVSVKVGSFSARDVESPADIYLGQGIARGEKMDFIVQKAVELGVKKIIPLITQRCNVRLNQEQANKRLLHWQSVAVGACEQSGRNHLPEILMPLTYEKWLKTIDIAQRFVLTPHVQNAVSFSNLEKKSPLLLLIGPEGGLSDDEVEAAMNAEFLAINLGPRVLRTETASIAAISILQAYCGDMN